MSRKRRKRGGTRPGPEGAPAKGEAAADETPSKSGGWGETAKSLGLAVVIFLVLRAFVVQTFFITSGSMEDTLLVGDFLVVNRAAVGSRIPFTSVSIPGYSKLKHGDIIVFDPHHEDDLMLVKRLIGLPGDTLEMRDKILWRNGVPQDEPYVKSVQPRDEAPHPDMRWQTEFVAPGVDRTTYRPTRDNWGPLVIPEDRYFMLGDNRDSSYDSRYWGLLERWRLEGRVSFIYYSYNQGSYRQLPWLREIRWGRIFDRVR